MIFNVSDNSISYIWRWRSIILLSGFDVFHSYLKHFQPFLANAWPMLGMESLSRDLGMNSHLFLFSLLDFSYRKVHSHLPFCFAGVRAAHRPLLMTLKCGCDDFLYTCDILSLYIECSSKYPYRPPSCISMNIYISC